jgi:hypothetical protein
MDMHSLVLLYLGPETIMPLGSFLAAAVGILLIFWRQATAMVRNSFRRVLGRKSGSSESNSGLDLEGPGHGQRSPGRD